MIGAHTCTGHQATAVLVACAKIFVDSSGCLAEVSIVCHSLPECT